jgi:hypothetical protein
MFEFPLKTEEKSGLYIKENILIYNINIFVLYPKQFPV